MKTKFTKVLVDYLAILGFLHLLGIVIGALARVIYELIQG